MNIHWDINDNDISHVGEFVRVNQNALVANRVSRNVERTNLQLDRNSILKNVMMCLLTSQQRSGPNSPVAIFLRQNPFPITVDSCKASSNVKSYVQSVLLQNHLTRFTNKIPSSFESIHTLLKNDWNFIEEIIASLDGNADVKMERSRADQINVTFPGFGPKQSRNFLQALGLTKFEIPIDSRITSWFNKFGFPVTLSSNALQDRNYYHFVSDGIQHLCRRAEIYPCVLDAAIFSSFNNEEWTEANSIF